MSNLPVTFIDTPKWFKHVTGLEERELILNKSNSILSAVPNNIDEKFGPHLLIKNSANGKVWDAGAFKTWSLKELQNDSLSSTICETKFVSNTCIFEIHIRLCAENLANVEISALQASNDISCEGDSCPMFQVASNFNCCENASRSTQLDSGYFVTNLMLDSTQGPAAASGAGIAAISRVHAAFYDPTTSPDTWGQSITNQIELLGDEILKPHFPVINGKVFCNHSSEEWEYDVAQQEMTYLPHCRVGLHVSVSADFSRTLCRGSISTPPSSFVANHHTPSRIDQVFVAAMNMNANGVHSMSKQEVSSKRRFLLQAAYEGTYAAALMRRTEELYLTCVGGGCFANPMEDIAAAIAAAHRKYSHAPESRLRRVLLVLYPVRADTEPFEAALRAVGVQCSVVRHGSPEEQPREERPEEGQCTAS